MKHLILIILLVGMTSCTTCVPNEEYNCNIDGYVDIEEDIDEKK